MLRSARWLVGAGVLVALGTMHVAPALAAGPTTHECIAANDAAQDLQRAGKLRAAREQLASCIASTCPGPIRKDCAARLEELSRLTPTLVFGARDALGRDMPAVRVSMDGEPLVDHLDGTPVAVDAGRHYFTFESVDGWRGSLEILVLEGEKGRSVVAKLGLPGKLIEPLPAPVSSSRKVWGIVAASTGVAGVAVGSVLGLVARSTYNNAIGNECHGNTATCTPQGVSDGGTADAEAAGATAAFIAGGVLLAGGIALWATAPRERPDGALALRVGAAATPMGSSVSLSGSW